MTIENFIQINYKKHNLSYDFPDKGKDIAHHTKLLTPAKETDMGRNNIYRSSKEDMHLPIHGFSKETNGNHQT